MKLPGRRAKTPLLTEGQKAQEAQFGRCPKGHALPHRTNKGNCTPLFCAGSTPGKKETTTGSSKLAKKTAASLQTTALADADVQELAEVTTRIARAETRHKARMDYLKVPEFNDPKERDRWIEDKKQALIPLALADVEYSLKLGDQQERERARKEVLDMTGHGKREGGGGSTSPLIVLMGVSGNLAENPWVRHAAEEKEVKVIDATNK